MQETTSTSPPPPPTTTFKDMKHKIYKNSREYTGNPEKEIKLESLDSKIMTIHRQEGLQNISEKEMSMILIQ